MHAARMRALRGVGASGGVGFRTFSESLQALKKLLAGWSRVCGHCLRGRGGESPTNEARAEYYRLCGPIVWML